MNFRPIKMISMCVLVALTGNAGAARCTYEILKPRGNILDVSGIGEVSLGPTDDATHPAAWQGPISTNTCRLELGIIEAPFVATRPGTAYVTTYSGAMRSVALVDFGACKIRWQSKPFVGAVQIDGAGLKLDKRRLPFNEQCVPKAAR